MFSTAQCNACHPCRLGCSPTRMWHIPCWCLAQLVLPLACVCVAGRSLRGGLLGFCAAVPALEVYWPSLSAPWSAAMRSHCLVGHAVCLCNQLTSDIKFVSAQLTAGLGRSTSLQGVCLYVGLRTACFEYVGCHHNSSWTPGSCGDALKSVGFCFLLWRAQALNWRCQLRAHLKL
jgi:hypothetical protein